MSIDIGSCIVNGVKNLANKETGILAALFSLVYLIQDIGSQTIDASIEPLAETPLAIGSSLGLGLSILTISIIATLVMAIVALRFYSSRDLVLEESMYKENFLLPGLNLVAGTIVLAFLVVLGLFFLVIPGLFILTALYFYSFRIAVEDENFIEGLKSSYSLTKGNRFELFGLGVIVAIVSLVLSIVSLPLLIGLGLDSTLLALVSTISYNLAAALISLGAYSIAGQAYIQLLDISEDEVEQKSSN